MEKEPEEEPSAEAPAACPGPAGARSGAAPTIHASAVAFRGKGILILGPSGAGKSMLALSLMAHGARLVADDRVRLTARDRKVIVSAPAALAGLVEARGVGLLRAAPAGPTALSVVVDLGRAEDERLPPDRRVTLLGIDLPLVLGASAPHLALALRQLMIGGRAG